MFNPPAHFTPFFAKMKKAVMGEKKGTDTVAESEIVRDDLAIVRSILANERTLLSYVRTSLTIFLVGISLFKFFEAELIQLTGLVLIFLGSAVFLVGLATFRRASRLIEKESQQVNEVIKKKRQ